MDEPIRLPHVVDQHQNQDNFGYDKKLRRSLKGLSWFRSGLDSSHDLQLQNADSYLLYGSEEGRRKGLQAIEAIEK